MKRIYGHGQWFVLVCLRVYELYGHRNILWKATASSLVAIATLWFRWFRQDLVQPQTLTPITDTHEQKVRNPYFEKRSQFQKSQTLKS